MGSSLVTLDLGNSRLKACAWDELARVVARATFASDTAGLAQLAAWVESLEQRVARCALSSVAAAEREAALERALAPVLGRAVDRVLERPDPGLDIRCTVPELVGRDRLFAARGALEHVGEHPGALVVDLGTALTVDAVMRSRTLAARSDTLGVFLGGAIAPGPRLAAEALAERTARLPRIEPTPLPAALGRSTEEAIASGVGIGVLGAARELVARIAREAGLDDAPVVVTGGASAFLDASTFGARPRIDDPDLVQRGLLAALLGERA